MALGHPDHPAGALRIVATLLTGQTMLFSQVKPGQRFRYFPTDPKMAEIVSGFVYQKLAKPMPIERVWHSATYNATQKLPNPLKGMKTSFSPYTKVEVVE